LIFLVNFVLDKKISYPI